MTQRYMLDTNIVSHIKAKLQRQAHGLTTASGKYFGGLKHVEAL